MYHDDRDMGHHMLLGGVREKTYNPVFLTPENSTKKSDSDLGARSFLQAESENIKPSNVELRL